MTDYLKALRGCNGGESVHNGKTATACSYCSNGMCRELPLCEVVPPAPPTDAERAQWRMNRIAAIQTPFD